MSLKFVVLILILIVSYATFGLEDAPELLHIVGMIFDFCLRTAQRRQPDVEDAFNQTNRR